MNAPLWQDVFIYFLLIWALVWKGLALWRAANLKQRNWFVVMVVLNTFGLLEIVYLFRFAKKRLTFAEMKSWKNHFVKQVPEKK
jgi:uncharacterized protein DUF5652